MGGTLIGGRKAAKTNKERYGDDFYKRLGEKGGKASAADGAIKGFAANNKRAKLSGQVGGKLSKRGHKFLHTKRGYNYYQELSSGEIVRFKA